VSSGEFLNFIGRAHKIMKLDLVGLNLIVMKEEIHVDDQHGLEIYPEMKKNEDTGKYEIVLA
tara:strand:- start:2461 stop:2646 length:186 start_codon:yes stop_codon:yes gene_type:complete